MTIIGLEINDTGILAAGGSPAELLDLDGQLRESPGFALPRKKGLLVGKAAESKAHLFPRQILNHFWDQLNTEPLEQTGRHSPQNHAEIVYRHLSSIWQQLQSHGDEIVMAVPSFFDREQLGLILGITQELEMPVKGFVPLSLAASADPSPEKMLMFLDIHLHRIEVIYLEQDDHLTVRDSATTADQGLHHLYRGLVEMIAQQFVRLTRYDPFHQAASEQELYDRLPGILSHLQHNSSMIFEIAGGTSPYSITLQRDEIIHNAAPIYSEVLRLIKRMQNKRGTDQTPLALQLSHRMARLPGCQENLTTLNDVDIIELDRGAAARGVPQIWHELAARGNNQGISFFTNRPWQHKQQKVDHGSTTVTPKSNIPTHLLYGSIAYPISEKPLTIGCAKDSEGNHIMVSGETTGVYPRHCTVERRGSEVILTDTNARGTYVDEKQVNGSIRLKLGQIIRVGTPGETLQLIACIQTLSE